MRKIGMAIAFIGALASCSQNNQLKVNGTIDGLENDKFIVAELVDNRPSNIDTIEVVNGKFSYTEAIEGADFRLFLLESNPQKGIFFWADNDNVTITGSLDSLDAAKINGSEANDLYTALIADFKKIQLEKGQLYQEANMAQQQQDSVKLESLKDAIEQNDKKVESLAFDFAKTNSDSKISPWVLNTLVQKFEYDSVNPIYETLSQEVKDSKYGKALSERLVKLSKLAVGAVAPDFTLTTTTGEEFTLSAQKGKVVLVDFWAHWCKPCRAENPNNVALVTKYGLDKFVIAGISVDRPADKDKWIAAIAEDGINYPQMLDILEINKNYDVRFIPTTVLIGVDGKIIAKNLRGEELAKKLEEVLGN